VPAIQRLAASATSIHIRLAGQPHRSVTLRQDAPLDPNGRSSGRQGVPFDPLWPLERLRRGLPFDVTDSGGDVRPAPCTPHAARRTPHPAPCTPQAARRTLHPAPRIPHPAPCTPHSAPATHNPQPATRNPQPARCALRAAPWTT